MVMIISQSSTSWSRNWCCRIISTRSFLNSRIHGELLLKKLVVVNSRKRCCRAAVTRWFWDHFSNFHFSNFLWVCLTADQLFMRSLKDLISQACWLCACKCAAGRQHSKSSFNHFEVTSQASWFCACQCTTKQFLNHFVILYQTSLLCACKWAAGRQQSNSSLNLRCSLTSWQRQWCICFAGIQWSIEAHLRENRGACV